MFHCIIWMFNTAQIRRYCNTSCYNNVVAESPEWWQLKLYCQINFCLFAFGYVKFRILLEAATCKCGEACSKLCDLTTNNKYWINTIVIHANQYNALSTCQGFVKDRLVFRRGSKPRKRSANGILSKPYLHVISKISCQLSKSLERIKEDTRVQLRDAATGSTLNMGAELKRAFEKHSR